MADLFLSGKDGSVKISTTAYSFGKWKAALKIGLPKVTNFTSGGYQLLVAGITAATITLEGPYNSGNMPFTVGTSATWILGFSSSVSLTITGFIESIEPDNDVEGSPRISMTIQSSGAFTAAIV